MLCQLSRRAWGWGWHGAHMGGPGDARSGTGNLMGRSHLLGNPRGVAEAQILSWGVGAAGTLGGGGRRGEGAGLQAPSAPGVSPDLVVTTKVLLWSDLKHRVRPIRD